VGGKIAQTYYAPGISSPDNQMRKPNPGMAYQAKRHFPEVDFTKSVMVGDTDSDMLFGQRLGMRTVRIKTVEPIHIPADLTVNNLTELLNFWS
jgi:HAD superfamily hydrolase (TIGR01662 family)